MRGIRQVFSFTLSRQFQAKSYRVVTILAALLLFLLPAAILPAVAYFGGEDGPAADESGALPYAPAALYVADEAEGPALDLGFLRETGIPGYEAIALIPCASLDEAVQKSAGDAGALLFRFSEDESGYAADVLIPDGSAVSESQAESFGALLSGYLTQLKWQKAGLTAAEVQALIDAPAPETPARQEDYDPLETVREVLGYALPYLNIMIIYFLVLFYGQGVANCVLMEKSSKLMDTFLVSVKPSAMIFGKVFAVWLSSVIQFVSWVLSLVLGFAAGAALARAVAPDATMAILAVFDLLGGLGGLFTAGGVIVAVLLVLAGFLLYCAIASIGGALAGKAEDLSSTNVLFTLVLIVSFFITLRSGISSLSGEAARGVTWTDLVPFTAILITPSRVLLGYVSLPMGLLSLGLAALACALLLLLAGKIYRLMALYKGNPPKLRQLAAMLRGK